MDAIVLESVLTCPHCGFARQETMPTDACQFFYECGHCKALLRANPGDCCVFCSFGSAKCPPMQQQRGGCEAGSGCQDNQLSFFSCIEGNNCGNSMVAIERASPGSTPSAQHQFSHIGAGFVPRRVALEQALSTC